jgi:hypothetical protein
MAQVTVSMIGYCVGCNEGFDITVVTCHFRANFLIGCSDQLAGVDFRSRVIWSILMGPGNDCSGSDVAPLTVKLNSGQC